MRSNEFVQNGYDMPILWWMLEILFTGECVEGRLWWYPGASVGHCKYFYRQESLPCSGQQTRGRQKLENAISEELLAITLFW